MILGGFGADVIKGGRDGDVIDAGGGDDAIYGGPGNDVVRALDDFSRGDDTVLGGKGEDQLAGGRGADRVDGGHGADTLDGGAGDDRLTGGQGADIFRFFSAHGVDRVADFGRDDQVTLTRNINGTGIQTLEEVAARISDGSDGAYLDLGGANGAIFESCSAEALRAAFAGDGLAFFA